jgi:hypothetical protein
MNFTNGVTKVSLYINDNKIFIDGVLHQITEIKVNTSLFSRFKFGVYEAKISNNVLTYTNTSSGTVKSLTKADQEEESQNEIWNDYIVHGTLEVSLSSDKKKIKINDEVSQVTMLRYEGIYSVYVCGEGILSISKNERLRKSMWNNIFINLKG